MLTGIRSYRRAVAGVLCLLAAAGYPALSSAELATAGPPAPTTARVWFYQPFSPGEAMSETEVTINGSVAGLSRPGYRFYRDLAPGTYRLGVGSFGTDVNQARDVSLAPGQEFYVKIASLRSWATTFNYGRDTFYVWPMPPAAARLEIAQTTD